MINLFNSYIIFSRSLVIDYPSPSSLSYFWNLGSFLGFLMVLQILTGILLLFYFIPSWAEAFSSVDYMTRETDWGIFFRVTHLNGGSLLFVFLYLHLSRGIFFYSFRLLYVWTTGVFIVLLMMVTAFLGYVLPMGQMSFWAATVITNLISTIPYCGEFLVLWVWGSFSVNKASLSLFFLLHFLMPFVILGLIFFHLIFLHLTSSTNFLFVQESYSKIKFFPYFVIKDIFYLFFFLLFFSVALFFPWTLGDTENWIEANPMSSPVHIQPEWYFLYAYAILRCVPNKLGGVIALAMSVLCLLFLLLKNQKQSPSFLFSSIFFVVMIFSFFLLTWLGMSPVEAPYIFMSQLFSFMFFSIFLIFFL